MGKTSKVASIKKGAEKITWRATAELVPYAKNSRIHSDAQIQEIANSITEFGFTNPVLLCDNGVLAGHGRLLAAEILGMGEVPTIDLGYLSEVQQRAYVLADNKLALNSGWDYDLLASELQGLNEIDFNLSLIGFNDVEIADLLNQGSGGLTDEDGVPPPPEAPATELGDAWILGGHRLVCGDASSLTAVKLLMSGDRADLIFTDPPYGMSYGGGRAAGSTVKGALVKAHGMILNDDLVGDSLMDLVGKSLVIALAFTKSGAALYCCFTWRTYTEFEAAIKNCGRGIKACIVWDKKSIGLGRSDYRPQHEFIFYSPGEWYGDKAESDVWYMSRGGTGDYVHPTQKPVELIERALINSSKGGDIVLDSFGGSGSTLIAAHKTGRKARLLELDPKYCDVIIQRWQDYTGEQARHEDGTLFDDRAPATEAQNAS